MKVKGTALLAGAAAGLIALTLTSTPSEARWRGGGWRGGGWRPGVALGAAAVGLGVGLAARSAWGYPGYGYSYGYPAGYYGGYGGYYGGSYGCVRQAWYAGAWRWVNVC